MWGPTVKRACPAVPDAGVPVPDEDEPSVPVSDEPNASTTITWGATAVRRCTRCGDSRAPPDPTAIRGLRS